jgi:hypothetical protein
MPNIRQLDPMMQMVAAVAAHRAILGAIVATIGDTLGDKDKLIRDVIKLASADIDKASFSTHADLEDLARQHAQNELASALGRLRGSPSDPKR